MRSAQSSWSSWPHPRHFPLSRRKIHLGTYPTVTEGHVSTLYHGISMSDRLSQLGTLPEALTKSAIMSSKGASPRFQPLPRILAFMTIIVPYFEIQHCSLLIGLFSFPELTADFHSFIVVGNGSDANFNGNLPASIRNMVEAKRSLGLADIKT